MSGRTLLNGKPLAAQAFFDRGLHFGDGLFETIAVSGGHPCLWSRHMARLSLGCIRLALPEPSPELLWREALQVCAGVRRGVLKIILTAGNTERGYGRSADVSTNRWLRASDWPAAELYQSNRSLWVQYCRVRLGHQPQLAGIKHLNRLEQVLARNELPDSVDEGLMLNQAGEPVEAIAANLLVRYDGRWITPPLDGCGVAGVVRGLLLDQAKLAGETITVQSLSTAQLELAEAVYLTSSLLGVRRVGRIGGRQLDDLPMPHWLQQAHTACFIADEVVHA